MDQQRTQFDYLLNELELASQSAHPSQEGYGEKRLKLFAYVRELERKAAAYDAHFPPGDERLLRLLVEAWKLETSREWEGMTSYHPKLWSAMAELEKRLVADGVQAAPPLPAQVTPGAINNTGRGE